MRIWVAVGEGVEAGSEEDVLGCALCDGCGQGVFGVAAAGYEEGPEGDREGLLELGGGFVEFVCVLLAEEGDGDGVFEDKGRGVVELMGGAAEGYA
jgi:hypothetical protein